MLMASNFPIDRKIQKDRSRRLENPLPDVLRACSSPLGKSLYSRIFAYMVCGSSEETRPAWHM